MLQRLKKLSWRVIVPWTLFVLTAAAAVTFFVLWQEKLSEEEARDEVTEVARSFISALTNFSADTIETDATEIRSYAVGDFEEEAETFFGGRAIEAIQEAEASSTGEIRSLFVQSLDDDEASIFGVVEETVENSSLPEAQTDTLRLEVGLIETSSGWKVNRVDVFQSPGAGLIGG
ncbi:MAG TPA: hypothetical protein VFS18_00700 [Actinomycetota bacterium]|nr:hypothetical protein [Actinomycetota bacterium]